MIRPRAHQRITRGIIREGGGEKRVRVCGRVGTGVKRNAASQR